MRLLPFRIWFGIALAAAALMMFWVFTPSERDRWVKADGAIACRDEAEVVDIVETSSASLRRLYIEEFVKDEKCMLLLAKERVRLHEMSTDGTRAKVTLGRNGQPMWVVVSDLKAQSDAWVSAPWLWPDNSVPSQPKLTDLDKRTGPDGRCTDWSHALRHSYMDECWSREERAEAAEQDAPDKRAANEVESKQSPPVQIAREETSVSGETWHRIVLPQGVSLELPSNWSVMDENGRRSVEQFVQSMGKWTIKGHAGLMSTLYSPSGKIVAQASFRFYSGNLSKTVAQADIKRATRSDLDQLQEKFREGLEKGAGKFGAKVWDWQDARKQDLGEFSAVVSEYKARFAHEEVDRRHVRIRVYDGPLSFSLLLNYEDSAHAHLRPVIDRIANSLARARAAE